MNCIVSYSKNVKNINMYCLSIIRFRFTPLFVLIPIALLFFIYCLIAYLFTYSYDFLVMFLSSGAIFVILSLVILRAIILSIKQFKSLFKTSSTALFQLSKKDNIIFITNFQTNETISFPADSIKRKAVYKKVIIIEIKNERMNGTLTFPNEEEIKSLLE